MFEKHIGLKSKIESTGEIIDSIKGIKDRAREMLKRFYARIGRTAKVEEIIKKRKEGEDLTTFELEPKTEGETDGERDDALRDEVSEEYIIEEGEIEEDKDETTSEKRWGGSDDAEELNGIFPDRAEDIVLTEYLGGSSGVKAGYFNGELFVVKKARESVDEDTGAEQINTEQLVDEYIADRIYEAMGFSVPVSKIYDKGRHKVAKFVPGKDLNTFYKDQPEFKKIKNELQKGFVLDCLLANWDVVGTAGGDNIRLGDDGKVYRLDNGGALRFRARGGKKGSDFGGEVNEIDSLRVKNKIFSDISDEEMIEQFDEILRKYEKIFGTIGTAEKELNLPDGTLEKLKNVIEKRIEFLVEHFKKFREKKDNKTEKGIYESAVTNNYFEGWDKMEIEGNPQLKEQIRRNIVWAEDKNRFIYSAAARNLGVSVEEFKARLQAKMENMVRNSNFFSTAQINVLDKIINIDGRWKSQFETATSNVTLLPAFRAKEEMSMFGFNRDKVAKGLTDDYIYSADKCDPVFSSVMVTGENKEKRPIYGYFSDDEHGAINGDNGMIPPPTNVIQYGKVNFKIKKEAALRKATVTFHDSLGRGRMWPPTPASKPHFTSLLMDRGDSGIKILKNPKGPSLVNWGVRYTEVQFHGQLTIDDVESIHVSSRNDLYTDEIEKVREIFNRYKQNHPESTIQLIEF